MAVLVILFTGFYLFSLPGLVAGWRRVLRQPGAAGIPAGLRVSVVVAFRDEAQALPVLLKCLAAQRDVDYEVVLVDDASHDGSVAAIRQFLDTHAGASGTFRLVASAGEGKKQALTTGIGAASGHVIVTTDADCTMGDAWLATLTATFADERVQFVAGPVRIGQGGRFFDDLQAIEFASLIGVSGAAMAAGHPVMCNGANLAFRKAVFEEVHGYAGNLRVASGDDEFLMRKVAARYPVGMRYTARAGSVVTTQASSTLRVFFNQRLRWASKWGNNTSVFAQAVAVYVFLLQLSWLAVFYLAVTQAYAVWLALLAARLVFEAAFLLAVCRTLGVVWRWGAFLALQFLYPVYVVVVALASRFLHPVWKGRKRQAVS